MTSWDKYFLEMCEFVSRKSKDPSTKVGCVIVGPDKEVRSTGFNGFCRGIQDKPELPFYRNGIYQDTETWKRFERPEKYMWTEHAERNAIYNAARVGIPLKDCIIYVQMCPCSDCARGIIQSGITQVICPSLGDDEFVKRWAEHIRVTQEMFQESGIEMRVLNVHD